MSFTVDYNKYYKEDEKACGEPFNEIIDYLELNKKDGAKRNSVTGLDLGCGQGRDAIPMAKMGYTVTAVDVSKIGLSQLDFIAKQQKLKITTVVSDIIDFKTCKKFDAIVIDRVLHILPNFDERKIILTRAESYLKTNGILLIADTPQNIKTFKSFFQKNSKNLELILDEKNYAFYKK